MKIPVYLLKNKYQLLVLLVLLLFRSVLELFNYPFSGMIYLYRVGLFLLVCIVSLFIIKKATYKLLTIVLVIAITLSLDGLYLWKIPAKRYVKQWYTAYEKPIRLVIENEHITSIHSLGNHDFFIRNEQGVVDSTLIGEPDKQLLLTLLESDTFEVEKNELGTMFIMYRFIDNGNGLLYATAAQIEEMEKAKRFWFNGYEITGYTKIDDDWYVVSFT